MFKFHSLHVHPASDRTLLMIDTRLCETPTISMIVVYIDNFKYRQCGTIFGEYIIDMYLINLRILCFIVLPFSQN